MLLQPFRLYLIITHYFTIFSVHQTVAAKFSKFTYSPLTTRLFSLYDCLYPSLTSGSFSLYFRSAANGLSVVDSSLDTVTQLVNSLSSYAVHPLLDSSLYMVAHSLLGSSPYTVASLVIFLSSFAIPSLLGPSLYKDTQLVNCRIL